MRDLLIEDNFIAGCDSLDASALPLPIQIIQYDAKHYRPSLFDDYAIEQPSELATWVPERQAQFLAGRIAAKRSIATSANGDNPVLIGQHREPIWPEGLSGSISHSPGISVATSKLKQTSHSNLGIDLQSIIDSDTQAAISSSIINPEEQRLIKGGAQKLSEPILFTLIFSAKESFFKALFNTVGEYFDFDAVEVVSIDLLSQQLRLRVVDTLVDKLPKNLEVDVAYTLFKYDAPTVITLSNWEL